MNLEDLQYKQYSKVFGDMHIRTARYYQDQYTGKLSTSSTGSQTHELGAIARATQGLKSTLANAGREVYDTLREVKTTRDAVGQLDRYMSQKVAKVDNRVRDLEDVVKKNHVGTAALLGTLPRPHSAHARTRSLSQTRCVTSSR